MTTLLLDHFTDTDAVSLDAHSMDTGAGWIIKTGPFEINSNRARCPVATYRWAIANAGAADHVTQCTMQMDNSGEYMGLIVRSTLNDFAPFSYWRCWYDGQAGLLKIDEMNAGSATTRASQAFSPSANTDYVFTVTCSGDDITFQVDSGTPLTYNSTFLNTATYVGLIANGFSGARYVRYEDFSCADSTPDPDPPTALSLTQSVRLVGLVDDPSFDFTVQISGAGTALADDVIVTPHVSPGATITPSSITLHNGVVDESDTFTITPTRTGNHSVYITNDGGLTNPAALVYAVKDKSYLFQDGFETGDFSLWDGTYTVGAGVAQAQGGTVKDGSYAAEFDCPNGNNDGSPPPDDRAIAYKQFAYPASNVLWMESDFQFVGADTDLQFGGGFILELASAVDAANATNRWNVEIYAPSQEFDDPSPYNGEYPISLEGTADAGIPRIHSGVHVWCSPDTWYRLRMRISYDETNPTADFYLDNTYVGTLTDTSVLSAAATPPTWLHIGCPWWDEAVKERVFMDNVAIYAEVDAAGGDDAATKRHKDPALLWIGGIK
jgi:hypothetical protein